jgi:hypothetical protein
MLSKRDRFQRLCSKFLPKTLVLGVQTVTTSCFLKTFKVALDPDIASMVVLLIRYPRNQKV